MSRRKSAERHIPRLTNDTLKAIYAALLTELPPRAVGEFWRRNPMPLDGTVMSPAETIEELWRGSCITPLDYVVGVYNNLEWFLSEHGREVTSFVRDALGGMGRGLYLTPLTMLAGVEPLLVSLFSAKNMRGVILDRIHLSAERMLPGLTLRQVASGSDAEWSTALIMLAMDGRDGLGAPPVDTELFVALPIQMAPLPTGLPAFEEVTAVADPRPAGVVAAPATGEVRNGRLLVDGDIHGEEVGFHDLCARYDFDPCPLGIPDRPVVVVTSDYVCGRRKRAVLREGCAYGAPVSLVKVRYRTHTERPSNPLSKIIRELTDGHSPRWKEAEQRHLSLLEELRGRHVFVYRSAKGTISVDDRHLASKVPAKILRNVLRAHLADGRTRFEHRQFVDDPEIVSDPSNPNFALRLGRLIEILERKLPDVVLERTGRGRFRLRTNRRIELREE